MIPLSRPDLGSAEKQAVAEALASGWVSGTGPDVGRLEAELRGRLGRSHVIATSSGTSALELAMRALGIGPGDEVVVPALTFAAPALTALALGATPVLADVTESTWTLDPDDVESRLTRRTRVVVAVDVLGHSCDFDAILRLGVPVIEDAAQGHGGSYRGRPLGSHGVVSVLSFHANKSVTTGEGGCVATDEEDLANAMRVIANHGMSARERYRHTVIGRNFRMGNLAAALGVAQVRRWEELTSGRTALGRRYAQLAATPLADPRPVAAWAGYSCWLHTLRSSVRDEFVAFLRRAGCDARAIWPALSTQPLINPSGRASPVAESVAAEAFWVPTSSALTVDEVDLVCEAMEAFCRAGRREEPTPPRADGAP
jgi:perosamine synthetase